MNKDIHERETDEELNLKELEKEFNLKTKKSSKIPEDIIEKLMQFVKDSPPLFLPVGSIRAVLALILIAISGVLMVQGTAVPEWLYSSVVMVLGFYFGARNGKTK